MEESKRYLIYKKDNLLCAITLLPKFESALKQGFKDGEVIKNEIISIERGLEIIQKYKEHIDRGNEQKIKIVEQGGEYERQIIDSDNSPRKRLRLLIKVKKGGGNVQNS